MDLDTVSADEFGRSLRGLGVNLLSRDVLAFARFLEEVFGLGVSRLSEDFCIARHAETLFQIHADGTYAAHPVLGFVPEVHPRGGGLQLYLFDVDPDTAAARARAAGHVVAEEPADKPHGLRECTILSPDGYAFSPAVSTV